MHVGRLLPTLIRTRVIARPRNILHPLSHKMPRVEQQRLNGRRAVDLPLQGNLHLKIRAVALFLIDPGVLSACVFTDRATDERYIQVTYNDF
jgi:hypothetical protein